MPTHHLPMWQDNFFWRIKERKEGPSSLITARAPLGYASSPDGCACHSNAPSMVMQPAILAPFGWNQGTRVRHVNSHSKSYLTRGMCASSPSEFWAHKAFRASLSTRSYIGSSRCGDGDCNVPFHVVYVFLRSKVLKSAFPPDITPFSAHLPTSTHGVEGG